MPPEGKPTDLINWIYFPWGNWIPCLSLYKKCHNDNSKLQRQSSLADVNHWLYATEGVHGVGAQSWFQVCSSFRNQDSLLHVHLPQSVTKLKPPTLISVWSECIWIQKGYCFFLWVKAIIILFYLFCRRSWWSGVNGPKTLKGWNNKL